MAAYKPGQIVATLGVGQSLGNGFTPISLASAQSGYPMNHFIQDGRNTIYVGPPGAGSANAPGSNAGSPNSPVTQSDYEKIINDVLAPPSTTVYQPDFIDQFGVRISPGQTTPGQQTAIDLRNKTNADISGDLVDQLNNATAASNRGMNALDQAAPIRTKANAVVADSVAAAQKAGDEAAKRLTDLGVSPGFQQAQNTLTKQSSVLDDPNVVALAGNIGRRQAPTNGNPLSVAGPVGAAMDTARQASNASGSADLTNVVNNFTNTANQAAKTRQQSAAAGLDALNQGKTNALISAGQIQGKAPAAGLAAVTGLGKADVANTSNAFDANQLISGILAGNASTINNLTGKPQVSDPQIVQNASPNDRLANLALIQSLFGQGSFSGLSSVLK